MLPHMGINALFTPGRARRPAFAHLPALSTALMTGPN